jgi:DNA replication protein DnaC
MWVIPEFCECPGNIAEQADIDERAERIRLGEIEKQKDHRRKITGISKNALTRTANDICLDYGEAPTERALKCYASQIVNRELQNRDKPGLFIYGNIGIGKSYIAETLAVTAFNANYRVRFATDATLIERIRSAMDDTEISEYSAIKEFSNAEFLVIDDLGKCRYTEWGIEKLFQVIDNRCRDELPTVITSNYAPNKLVDRIQPHDSRGRPIGDTTTAQSIVDRIARMCALAHIAKRWRARE